jgi:hypothetical protein
MMSVDDGDKEAVERSLRGLVVCLLDLAKDLDNGRTPARVAEQLRLHAAGIRGSYVQSIGDNDIARQRAKDLEAKYGSQTNAAFAVGISQQEMHFIISRGRGKNLRKQTLRKLGIRRTVVYELLAMPDETECQQRLQATRRKLGREHTSERCKQPPPPPPLLIERRLKLEHHLIRQRNKARQETT